MRRRVAKLVSRRWWSGEGSGCRMCGVDEPERPWRPGERLELRVEDGQRVWVRVVEVAEDGTVRVMPESAVTLP